MKFCEVDIECAVEPKGRGNRGHDLSYQTIEIGVGWSLDVQIFVADIVNGLNLTVLLSINDLRI